jgi:hypothetical protein
MKLFKILLLGLLITSCSTDSIEEGCGCVKEVYNNEVIVVTRPNGTMGLDNIITIVSTEVVGCQDEQTSVSIGNGNYFNITCN